jgi:hypothetical protein
MTTLSAKTQNELKDTFGVIDEHELADLAQVDVQTVRQWRSRRIGPRYIQVGKARLYFKKDVITWFQSIRKETTEFDGKVMV